MELYIQLNHYIISSKLHCTPTYTTLVRNWIRTGSDC